MVPPLKNFPLSVRLVLIGGMFSFNYFLFPLLGAMLVLPFCGMVKVESIFAGNFVSDIDRYIFLFAQAVASLGTFAFTSLIVSQLETGFVVRRLALGVKPALKLIAIAVIGTLVAQAFIQFLVELNQKLPVPDALRFLIESEKKQEQITSALVKGSSLLIFLANTLVLAVIPAIGEEMFFRGVILGELLKSKISPVLAIIVSGLLFSIAHTQYDNFLAIWVLGSFLGFLYYISGSLWLSVTAHFINNFLVVFLKYLYNGGFLRNDVTEASIPWYATIISIVLFAVCLFILNNWRRPVDFAIELDEPDIINEEEHYI